MDDLISRQAAVRWVKTECNPYGKPTLDFESGKKVIEHLEQMPSADRPQGEWLAVSSYDAFGGSEELWNAHGNPTALHYCSKCKAQSYVNEFGEELLTDYCPNCGARMKGADDEV